MPIREYKCNDCGFQFESIDLGSDKRRKTETMSCPGCGSRDLGKKVSLFSSFGGDSSSGTKPAPKRFG